MLILVLMMILIPSLSWGATSHGVGGSCELNSAASCNISLTGVTAGSAIVVTGVTHGSQSTISASDGVNTYSNSLVTGSGPSVGSLVACNVASGNPTITVTFSSSNFGLMRAREVIGAAASGCLEARASNTQSSVGTGTDAITSGTIGTPAGSGAYVYGVTVAACCTAVTISTGTGFTSDISSSANGVYNVSEYLIQGSPASAAATFTASVGSINYETHGLIIKAADTTISGCRLLQDGTSKRLLQNGTDGRIFQNGGSCGLGGGGTTVVPVRMLMGVGL